MVKIPELFDLLLPRANPSRREFLSKGARTIAEPQPAQMDSLQLLKYLRGRPDEGRKGGWHTSWALEAALRHGSGNPDDLTSHDLVQKLMDNEITPEELQLLATQAEQVMPEFRRVYDEFSNSAIQKMFDM